MASTPVKKVSKVVAPKKPADHPPYLEMIMAAIKTLKERGGSSRQAIVKYVNANYKVPDTAEVHIKMALKRGVSNGKLENTKGKGASGSFKLTAAAKAAEKKPAKPKAKKSDKKPKKKPAAKPPKKKPAAKPSKKAATTNKETKPKKAEKKKEGAKRKVVDAKKPKKAAKKTPTKSKAKPKVVKKSSPKKKPAKK